MFINICSRRYITDTGVIKRSPLKPLTAGKSSFKGMCLLFIKDYNNIIYIPILPSEHDFKAISY